MVHLMDKNGRILCINASFYNEDGSKAKDGGTGNCGNSSLSAEELLVSLLDKLPASEFIRPPALGPAPKASPR